jgi:prepilin-type processing-associated H-X9-DG protein
MFFRFARTTLAMNSVPDGLSNTLFVGETLPSKTAYIRRGGDFVYNGGNWAFYNGGNAHASTIVPINYKITPMSYCHLQDGFVSNVQEVPERASDNWGIQFGFKSNHSGGANFVFGDGSVRFLSDAIDMQTYQLLGCRNDGLPVQLP